MAVTASVSRQLMLEGLRMFVHSRTGAEGLKSAVRFARPFAKRGMWVEVEQITAQVVQQGLAINEYYLNVMICAYAAAQPKQAQRAEAALRSASKAGVQLNEYIMNSLERVLGRSRAAELVRELGLKKPTKRQDKQPTKDRGAARQDRQRGHAG